MGFQGASAPSRKVLPASGTTTSRSTSSLTPRPSQSGQEPKGALKEKRRGSSSGTVKPQTGQA